MPFNYRRPESADAAATFMAEPGATALGGGTDLVLGMREGIAVPEAAVDLRWLPGARDIAIGGDGLIRLGAAVRLADIVRHPELRRRVQALVEACDSVGAAPIRNMGTLGGTLCQRPRCRYFRALVPCHKNGGNGCPAVDGENQFHAILGGGPCWIVHPSDVAVALVALEATFELRRVEGMRRVAASDFFVLPDERLDHETILAPGEVIAAVEIPAHSSGGVQRYLKLTRPENSDFAVVSLAALRRTDGEVRLVLGGVAPRPWRVYSSIEEDVSVGNLDRDDVATLAARAMYDAVPLSKNGYKVELAEELLRRGIEAVASE